ncbi:MAG: hypothetical protein WDZ88_01315 [Candidatus Paceibacterota bacterium]
MTLQDITKHIEAVGSAESEKILDEAKNKAFEISKKCDSDITELENSFDIETSTILEQTGAKVRNSAIQESKISLEREKTKLLQSVYSEAEKVLLSSDEDEYEKFLTNILAGVVINEPVVCYCPAKRTQITKKVLQKINITLSEMKEASFSAGLALEGKTFFVDLTLERILKDIKIKKNVVIAKLLFS